MLASEFTQVVVHDLGLPERRSSVVNICPRFAGRKSVPEAADLLLFVSKVPKVIALKISEFLLTDSRFWECRGQERRGGRQWRKEKPRHFTTTAGCRCDRGGRSKKQSFWSASTTRLVGLRGLGRKQGERVVRAPTYVCSCDLARFER